MRRLIFTALLLILLLASCAPTKPESVPTSIPSPIPMANVIPKRASDIRFALIGAPRDVNVWELFDESGASYADYALRAEYWPRLYHLALSDLSLQPLAAEGMPSEVKPDGDLYSATVTIRSNLKWTDGSTFSADDVAFTVNTAVAFELGLDWEATYPREYIDHAEALGPSIVKFYFKQKPNVGVWQYGALQGAVIQKAYWEPLITKDALDLLPDDVLRRKLQDARDYLATVNFDLNEMNAQIISLLENGRHDLKLNGDYRKKQDELIYAQNVLDLALKDYASRVNSAHAALYALDDRNEPLLGVWLPSENKNGVWINEANPGFPFMKPEFSRALYFIFADEVAAVSAFNNGEVDFILSPNGLSQDAAGGDPSPSYSARFLVVNPQHSQLMDTAFRLALSCMLDREVLANEVLGGQAFPLDSFVLSPQWHDPAIRDACNGMDKSARMTAAVKILKDAGYSWEREPNAILAGSLLTAPNGRTFPKVQLLAPAKDEDPLRFAAAKHVTGRAQYLGIPFAVEAVSLNDVVYAVFSSQKYDMAVMGWRLGEYPAYLCEWFGGENPHLYIGNRYQSACEAMTGETQLDSARQASYQIESELMAELPFIPLFRAARFDPRQNLAYPVEMIPNGWGAFYGAPSYAVPVK